ncbi:Ig-like domain-containing protein [Mesorhizobium atlanticum]
MAATGQGGRVRPCSDQQPCRRSGASDHGDEQPDARRSEQPCRDRRVRHGRHSGTADGSTHIQGTYGYLTIDSAGHYTYTLTTPEERSGRRQRHQHPERHRCLHLYGAGCLRNANTSTITISIKDDVPTAEADTDAAQSGETVTGNVETGTSTHGTGAADTAGADGIASIAWTSSVTNGGITTVTGTYGVLTVQADGSYSYKAFANTSGTDVFTYTIKDGDGDTLALDAMSHQCDQRPAAAGRPRRDQVDESGLGNDRQPCRRSGASDHGDGQPDARRSEQPCRDRRVRHGRLGHRRRLDPHPGAPTAT